MTFTATSGDEVEYWEYEYNLQGRLTKVDKNGELIAEFSYDANDNRIRTIEYSHEGTATTTNFIYNVSGKVMLEEKVGEDKFTSYIFAFNKHYAKVDGIVGVSTEITYFHYDNVGSTRVMTDASGKVVMDQDYLPFGGNLAKPGQIEVLNETGEEYKFTGQKEVASIGLYYYGARYYDPSIGRFITEDSYKGELDNPQTQHLYVYVTNNPLRYVDPTGHSGEDVTVTDTENIDYTIESGDTLSDISEEYYGSPDYAELIAETNPNIDDPDEIIAGDQIVLPQVPIEKDIISNNSFNTLSKSFPNQNNIVMGSLKETNLIPAQNSEVSKNKSISNYIKKNHKGYNLEYNTFSDGLYKSDSDYINQEIAKERELGLMRFGKYSEDGSEMFYISVGSVTGSGEVNYGGNPKSVGSIASLFKIHGEKIFEFNKNYDLKIEANGYIFGWGTIQGYGKLGAARLVGGDVGWTLVPKEKSPRVDKGEK